MKYALITLGILGFIAALMFTNNVNPLQEQANIYKYVKSHGKTAVPFTWRGKIGEGI